jgi:hypothetical protein
MNTEDSSLEPEGAECSDAQTLPQDDTLSEEERKRQAMRKRKPLGAVVKPLTKEQIQALLGDPEAKEQENLSDALPKGWDQDYQDEF